MTIDYSGEDRRVDVQLAEMAKEIKQIFSTASADEQKEIKVYWTNLVQRDAQMREKLAQGTITEQQYKDWMQSQIGRGERMEALKDKLAERATNALEEATAYINGEMVSIYTQNRNYGAYCVEMHNGAVGFDLWNEDAVRELIQRKPNLMPYYSPAKAVARGIDLEYSKGQITKTITQSILLGRGTEDTAEAIIGRLETMGYNTAMRTARTSTTAAQNGGRYAAHYAAAELGVELQNIWIATLDHHTRESHRDMDGEKCPVDGTFPNGLRYPGDPAGDPAEVYNCRCRMAAWQPGSVAGLRRARMLDSDSSEIVEYSTYREWEAAKKAEDPELWKAGERMAKNRSPDKAQFAEYGKLLGRDCPSKFSDFQRIKYTEPSTWAQMKKEAKKARGK